jgi:hypothetical protein
MVFQVALYKKMVMKLNFLNCQENGFTQKKYLAYIRVNSWISY